MNQTSNQTIEKLQDEHVCYKIYTFHAIFDVAYKDEKTARQIEDENGTHKDTVRPVYIILTEEEFAQEAEVFPIENYSSRSNYDYEGLKQLYLEDYVRVCNKCNDLLEEGYMVEGNKDSEWYCSEKCLHNKYTKEVYNQKFEDDEAFWTTV